MKVLIVDDEDEWQVLLEQLVVAAGHEAVSAVSGRRGLEAARKERPGAVLVDLTLPDMRGSEFLRRLREDPALAGLPVLILSGHHARDVERELPAGARFVSKDEGVDAIASALRAVTGGPP